MRVPCAFRPTRAGVHPHSVIEWMIIADVPGRRELGGIHLLRADIPLQYKPSIAIARRANSVPGKTSSNYFIAILVPSVRARCLRRRAAFSPIRACRAHRSRDRRSLFMVCGTTSNNIRRYYSNVRDHIDAGLVRWHGTEKSKANLAFAETPSRVLIEFPMGTPCARSLHVAVGIKDTRIQAVQTVSMWSPS